MLLIIFINGLAFGQTVKGTFITGGGLGYSNQKSPGYLDTMEDVTSEFALVPSIGYFVMDRLAVGVNLGYGSTKTEQSYGSITQTTKGSSFAFGPFARYYKHTSNESFAIYGEFSMLFGSGKTTDYADNVTKNKSFDVALAPGISYFFNEHWAFELGFTGISYTKEDPNKEIDDNELKTFNIGLNSLLPSTIGFRFLFK
jgi:hypothetical protein